MTSQDWRIRWAVSAVDEDGQPLVPFDDDGEPMDMAVGLTANNTPAIALGGRTAFLPTKVALDASTALRTVTEQAIRPAGER